MASTGLPDGPWRSEPDFQEWVTEAGYRAKIQRQYTGHLCGYVAVGRGHKAHGLSDSDLHSAEVDNAKS